MATISAEQVHEREKAKLYNLKVNMTLSTPLLNLYLKERKKGKLWGRPQMSKYSFGQGPIVTNDNQHSFGALIFMAHSVCLFACLERPIRY